MLVGPVGGARLIKACGIGIEGEDPCAALELVLPSVDRRLRQRQRHDESRWHSVLTLRVGRGPRVGLGVVLIEYNVPVGGRRGAKRR